MSRRRFFILLLLALVLAAAGYNLIWPDVGSLARRNPKKTAWMELREREWARRGERKRIKQVWVPYARISPYLIQAVLIAEDDKFLRHSGFDLRIIWNAFKRNIEAGRIKYGASTITQQLAKNLYLSPSKNPLRKIREAILTWRLEANLSKRRILTLYLNLVEWGEGVFGAEAAADHYYGCAAADLSPEQAARLAACLPNPRKYSPVGSSRFIARRAGRILRIMEKRGLGILW